VLVDADNLDPARLRLVAAELRDAGPEVRVVVAGHPDRLAAVRWPEHAVVVAASGWQRADITLAAAYQPDDGPLVVVSGDGDFALLAQRHDGPVLVVAPEAGRSARYRSTGAVVDPVHEGVQRLRDFLGAGPGWPVG
jgi:hypothetical protein